MEEEIQEYDDELTPEDSIIYEVRCWATREADRKPNLDDGEFELPGKGTVSGLVCYDAESRAGQCQEYSCPVYEGMYFSPDPDAVTAYFEFAADEEEEDEEEPAPNPAGVRPPGYVPPMNPNPNPPPVKPVEALGNAAKAALADAGSQILKDVVTEGLQGAAEMGKQAVKQAGKTLFTPPDQEGSG